MLRAPHIGDPEADTLAAHLIDHHRDGNVVEYTSFKALLREFRLQMAD